MGIVAFIFSTLAFYALLRLVNVEIYHFMPTGSSGPEGGLIDAALASLVGLVTSAIALLLSFFICAVIGVPKAPEYFLRGAAFCRSVF